MEWEQSEIFLAYEMIEGHWEWVPYASGRSYNEALKRFIAVRPKAEDKTLSEEQVLGVNLAIRVNASHTIAIFRTWVKTPPQGWFHD